MRRIIVSGANGFLGKSIIKCALAGQKNEVIAISSKNVNQKNVQYISTDSFLTNGCEFNPDDIFINCLFPTNADGFKLAVGIDKVFEIINKAYECRSGAIINVSSQSVYPSKRPEPASDYDQLSLESPYAVGKYCSELFVNYTFADRPHTNLRLASLIGPGYDIRIVNRMIDQALSGKTLKVNGGMQRYGFLDVEDAADAIMVIASGNPENWKEEYIVGKSESYTLLEVVECICSIMKSVTGQNVEYVLTEGQDTRNSAVNPVFFNSDFDWYPKKTLALTIENIIKSKISKAEK